MTNLCIITFQVQMTFFLKAKHLEYSIGYLSEILTVLYFAFREKEPELLRSGELLMREFEE